jgi:hypothetical protein
MMLAVLCASSSSLLLPQLRRPTPPLRAAPPRAATTPAEDVDVVVIGSGLGGLSCASLLASRGLKVSVLEAHYELGGCCHEFCVGLDGRTIPTAALAKAPDTPVFKFEAGPSLYSGLSPSASPNPLKHIFQVRNMGGSGLEVFQFCACTLASLYCLDACAISAAPARPRPWMLLLKRHMQP